MSEFNGSFANAEEAGRFLACCVDLNEMDGDISEVANKSQVIFHKVRSFYGINEEQKENKALYPISKEKLFEVLSIVYGKHKWKFLKKGDTSQLHNPMKIALGINRRNTLKTLLNDLPKDKLTEDLKTLYNAL